MGTEYLAIDADHRRGVLRQGNHSQAPGTEFPSDGILRPDREVSIRRICAEKADAPSLHGLRKKYGTEGERTCGKMGNRVKVGGTNTRHRKSETVVKWGNRGKRVERKKHETK